MEKIRLIASYLPQFQPIKENDEWWGKGFTEWTNVGKAKPLFAGHYQPRVPADLGYYDLRLPAVRLAQAEMAKEYGIEGFCYWHYWFGDGKRILEKTFDDILINKEPDFPFCLAWANETWSGVWHGLKNQILMEQKYLGEEDYKQHFEAVLPAFLDERYIKVDDKPIFMLYRPLDFSDAPKFIELWNKWAIENGLKGVYFIGQITTPENRDLVLNMGFDAVNIVRLTEYMRLNTSKIARGIQRVSGQLKKYAYKDFYPYFSGPEDKDLNCIPTIIPNWDHSPRSGKRALILHDSNPQFFGEHVKDIFSKISHKPDDNRISFIKSWNEWGEGNYLEPDLVHGHGYLKALREQLDLLNLD
ncbi:glycoside hydrolase family 99-like domain-containing protein [Flavobacterium sp. 1355]|uniref:glycosyltransferase WbsX family protein n=1 Tax=Flavobacterium sp. 1355 TaxID=2806571 RepID=UPI001AE5BD54|nr:glycoside hydrolase family 99-like domain-containing protein [Flavobacterium sp. 1355]MBP1224033.1 lipopolysaccharide biosynthesis protein [Flavobacterium sp. 1355]